ncbi:hypothetical protein UCRPC4_g02659 [Phaeomoniella chlamydospora]|uniref:Uncharacterized protein n=1 Tax=Phaeomoniella chlamydospora TaxID=158046 RepID=A0A0G2EP33_PHACM|nr:hypothetical protein UCRPC4_g02659 [Phaeomoniella chlamydospora]
MPSPSGPFWTLGLLRSLSITVFLSIAAFLIYASATNRFVLLMHSITPPPDPETYQRRSAQQISQLTVALQMANTKLNAYSITRNAVVRDEQLKGIDDEYWRAVVAMEGLRGIAEGGGIWDDEEVQAAIARTLGGQGLDVEKMNREARNFVGTVTKDLDRPA